MERIDADTHISNLRTENRQTAEQLLERLDTAGFNRALVWLQPVCDVAAQCRYVYESVRRYDNRLLGFGWVDPKADGVPRSVELVRRYVEEYGFYGVKLNGAQNDYDLLTPEYQTVVEAIAREGVVLAFHCGEDENTRPRKVAQLAARYPETRVLLVHMGQSLTGEAIDAAAQCPNITLVGSGMPDFRPVLTALRRLGARRVCFGSDAPFRNILQVRQTYDRLLDGQVTPEEKDMVMGGSLAALLNLR